MWILNSVANGIPLPKGHGDLIDRNDMAIIIHKALEDIKAKELDYGVNGAKVQILLGYDEAQVLLDALATSNTERESK